MSKRRWLIFGVFAAFLAIVQTIPLHRGKLLHCYGGMSRYYTRMQISGLPFGFLAMNRTGNACYATNNGHDIFDDPVRYDSYFFTPASFWFDLMASGAVLIGTYALLDKRSLTE